MRLSGESRTIQDCDPYRRLATRAGRQLVGTHCRRAEEVPRDGRPWSEFSRDKTSNRHRIGDRLFLGSGGYLHSANYIKPSRD